MSTVSAKPTAKSGRPLAAPAPIAVIGLGNMGRPMAACLAKAGYRVTGFDLSPDARNAFAAAGGKAAVDVKSAVAAADAVITLLPDGKIVRIAVEGLQPHLKPGAIIVEMSSSDPIGTKQLGAELIAAGFGFVDAPVSGGVKRAVNATLAIMVGGDGAAIDRVEPVLKSMGNAIFRTGDLGSGHAMKALNNYLSAVGLTAAVEALRIGKAFGLDPNLMTDILNASSGRNNATEIKLKPFVIPETYTAGFLMRLMAKDVRTADRLAAAIGVPAPIMGRVADLWDAAARDLGPAADHTEIGRYLEKLR
jgi:3-hydroxyisobutyrate dehydrogenase